MYEYLKKFWFISFSFLAFIQGVNIIYIYLNYSHSILFPGPLGLFATSLFLGFIYKTKKTINRTVHYIPFSILTIVYFFSSLIFTSCFTLRIGCGIFGLQEYLQFGIMIFIPALITLGLLVKFSKQY